MIRAHFNYQDNKISGFQLTGHADSGEYGRDIVCAAVSALAINTVNSLEQLVNIKPSLELDEVSGGLMKVELSDDQLQHPEAQLLLASLKLGLQDIEKNYDKYIKIK